MAVESWARSGACGQRADAVERVDVVAVCRGPMWLLDSCWSTGSLRGWCREAEPVGRGVVAPTACEPSAGGMTLSGCPIMMEAVLDGTTDPQAVHAAAEVRDRHAAGAWREAADRAGPRARRGPHDDLS